MARARNIKPGYYTNEELAQCSLPARFIFPGLWMLADRDGRLEDRPLRIKAEVVPFDPFDVDALLAELSSKGFILRYEVKGLKLIQVLAFSRHQNPHKKEVSRDLPAPSNYRAKPSKGTTQPSNNRNKPGVDGQISDAGPADSLLLNPSSLNPESLIPESLDSEKFRAVWDQWKKHRLEIKAPLKPSQAAGQLKKLAKEGELAACERIERSIANGWRGLWFADDGAKNGSARQKPDLRQQIIDSGNAFLDATGGAGAQHRPGGSNV